MLAKRLRQFGFAIFHPNGHLTLRRIIDRAKQLGIATQEKKLNWKYVGIYLDTRIDAKARRALITNHYIWMATRFPQSPFARDLQIGMPIWASVDEAGIEYSILMRSSTICPMEGEVELLFQDTYGRLAFLTFLFVPGEWFGTSGPVILVGGLQGGYGRREDYRRASKSNGEVTPMNLLVLAAKGLAEAVGATALLGMCHDGQIARPYADDKMYLNYDQAWTELGGVPQISGYFALEFSKQTVRPMDHLSSAHRKRARRKIAYKAEVQEQMRERFAELLQPDIARFGKSEGL